MIQKGRERTSGGFSPGPGWSFSSFNGSTGSGSSPKVGGKVVTRDTITRDYHKLVAEGAIIMNPYSSWTQDVSSGHLVGFDAYNTSLGPSSWARTTGNHADLSCGWGVDPPTVPTSPSAVLDPKEIYSLRQEVATRCLSQIGRGNVDNWENIAEISQTYQMLRHPIDQFWSFDRKFWKNKLWKLGQTTASLSKAWLMYRYGIKPLVESVKGTIESLKADDLPRVTTRSKGVISSSRTLPGTFVSGTLTSQYTETISATVQVRAVSIDDAILTMPQVLGLSTKSLLTLPWELVPYSFVADWFVNAGDYFGALANCLQPRSLGQCLVQKDVVSRYRESHTTTQTGMTVLSSMRDWVRVDDVFTYRQPWLPTPSLEIKSNFRFDDPVRIADALALVAKRVRLFPNLYYRHFTEFKKIEYFDDGSTA